MVRQTDPDFRIRAVRPSYSPSNRPATAVPKSNAPTNPAPAQRVSRPSAPAHLPEPANTPPPVNPQQHLIHNHVRPSPSRKPTQASSHKTMSGIRFASVALLMLAGGLLIFKTLHGKTPAEADAQTQTSSTAQVAAAQTNMPNIDETLLASNINQILGSYKGVDSAVSVIDLRTGKSYDYGDGEAYYAASVSKLLSASDFLKHVERGDYTLATQVAGSDAKTQLEKLIVDSDNNAWRGFIDLLTHDDLEAFAETYGVKFDAKQNTLNAHDTSVFIQKLYQNKILNQSNTKLLLSYMNRASTDQYLEANAPDGASVYQKAGWLDDRLHVTGIVTNGNNGYAVAIYSKVSGTYDFTVGSEFIKKIQTVLNNTFF